MGIIKVVNNYKMSTKLGVTYILCVLIPMLVTNTLMLSAIKQSSLEQQEITMTNVMDRIEYNIQSYVAGCVSVGGHLSTDKIINTFLVNDYTSNLEYFSNYKKLIQNNVLRYYYNSQRISQIILYADNPTLVNGGSFWRVDTIDKEEWYKAFKDSGQKMYLTTYYDENRRNFTVQSIARTISFIQEINSNGLDPTERFVKIDLQYNDILKDILNEEINGEIYMCNDKYVLFSNLPEESVRNRFSLTKDIVLENMKYQRSFEVVSDVWTIYLNPPDIDIWGMVQNSKGMIIALIIVNLLLPTMIITIISKSLTGRIRLMGIYLDKVKKEEFQIIDIETGRDEIGDLIHSYNLMVTKIKDLIEVVFKRNAEKQALELARKDAELKALQSQVNPHFMFNTLESIRMRSLIKGESETADIIGHLSTILRKSLSWQTDCISIEEEILFVKQYANIQRYRFDDKIEFSFYIMPGCEKITIPKLSIITFVENACVHGMESISTAGTVAVIITKDEKSLFIEMSDSGCGMSKEKLIEVRRLLSNPDISKLSESKSTGMLNALIRMNLYCNGSVQFEIDSELNQGVDIMIQIPLEKLKIQGERA